MDEKINEHLETETLDEQGNELKEEAKEKNKSKWSRGKKSKWEKKHNELKKEYEELKDKQLRLHAEFDNFRKRSLKEKLDFMKSASQETMRAILPILDDFDRAKSLSDSPDSEEKLSEGMELLYVKIYNVLSDQGLKVMETDGEIFDSELHEAVTQAPAPTEEQKGKILHTAEKGYSLNDKIIRHAKVVVGI